MITLEPISVKRDSNPTLGVDARPGSAFHQAVLVSAKRVDYGQAELLSQPVTVSLRT
jgi:hypothetical protein